MIDEENCIIFFRLIFKGIESFVYFDLEIIGFERIFDIVQLFVVCGIVVMKKYVVFRKSMLLVVSRVIGI